MESTAAALLALIERTTPLLTAIPAEQTTLKATPEKWSKREILGHLIDSASNNQQKFVRVMASKTNTVEFVGYDQDDWVATQLYNQANWASLIALWSELNQHLAHIMMHVEPAQLERQILVGGHGPFSLEFVMTDYVEHLKHHLKQILPEAGLSSSFSMAAYS